MNILFIGTENSLLSLIPLQVLIESKYNICAIACDQITDINVINSGSIQELALKNSIPIIYMNKAYDGVAAKLESLQPDVILVSCYARKLPTFILDSAKQGSFNIHPSLLPAFRGPSPLFWQFKEGIDNFGITLHRINDEFDAGNIVSQKIIIKDDGLSEYAATNLLAEQASELALLMLRDIENNQLNEKNQNNQLSSYQSSPGKDDYQVSTSWTAKRIFNFVSAFKGNSVTFKLDDTDIFITDVYSYQDEPYAGMNGKKIVQEGKTVKIACKVGYIECKVK